DAVDGVADRRAVLRQAGDERAQLDDQVGQFTVALADRGERRGQVVHDLADDLVLVCQRVGEVGEVGQQQRQRAALSLQRLDQLEGQLVDLSGVEALDQRL